MSANFDRVATLTREFADIAARIIRDRLSIPEEQASAAGMEIAQDVCDEFGGQLLYIPKGSLAKVDQRDRDLYAAYIANSRDANATAAQFGIAVQTVYRRIKLVESATYALRQGALFDSAD